MDVSEDKPSINTTVDNPNPNKVAPETVSNENVNPKTGMPIISPEAADKGFKKMFCYIPINITISMAIGIGIACLIHNYGNNEKYNKRLELAK